MNKIIEDSISKLKSKNFTDPTLDIRVLLNQCSNVKKELFLSTFEEKNINLKKFNNYLSRRLKYEPISKIIKKKSFWKYDFYVDSNVLDPRPETEFIIEESIRLFVKKNLKINVLDIGTGSGCLSICIAKEFKNSKIRAIDISNKAIKVAKKNIKIHNCKNQIKCKIQEIHQIKDTYDLIVSNPPYLSKKDFQNMETNIKKFEPKNAFLGGEDGLKFYRIFAKKLPNLMKKNSFLILEIGELQFLPCLEIFQNSGLTFIRKIKDFQKKDRILVFSKL